MLVVDQNANTQRSLLGEADLTLVKAMDISQGGEAAERNTKSFKNPEVIVQKVVFSTNGAETRDNMLYLWPIKS